MSPLRISFIFIFVLLSLAAATEVKADPLFFSNVVALQEGGARVDLFANPGTTLIGPQLSFLVDITGTLPPGVTNTLVVTYRELGGTPIIQSFQIPAFGTIQPPFTQLFTITSQLASFQGTPATLTIDILGSSPDFIIPGGPGAGVRVDSFTFSFNVAEPVPEPASLGLMGSGLIAIAASWRKRRRKSNLDSSK